MTVAELIELLKLCPQDAPVCLAYDSMTCVYDLTEPAMFIRQGDEGEAVFLCAMNKADVTWHLDEVVDWAPEDRIETPEPGRRIRPLKGAA